jgi:excisionase family DNA binding protein
MDAAQIRMDFETPGDSVEGGRHLNGGREASRRQSLTREDVMTASEVGALLGLASSSIYDLARRGAIPGHRVGRAWRFIRPEIEDWLRAS